jgi:hypothetical protein
MKNGGIPNVSLGEFGYEGTISLPAWREFLDGEEGVYSFDIGGDMVLDNPSILPEHIEAFNYAINNQNEILDTIVHALYENYSDMQSEYGYDEDEIKEFMPNVEDINDFKSLIGLSAVHIMNVFKEGFAYIGYEFSCIWDEEHGFGVMMHKDRIVKLGGADISILSWVAESDLE